MTKTGYETFNVQFIFTRHLFFGYEWATTIYQAWIKSVGGVNYVGMMWFVFLLQLVCNSWGLSGGTDHGTMCTSTACFTLHMDALNFNEARLTCDDNGGDLVTVRDTAEEDTLRSILSLVDKRHQENNHKFWIGLKLRKGDCVLPERTLKGFKWITSDEDSHYSNWNKEPDMTCTKERCVAVNPTSSGLKWVASSCRSLAFYACRFYFKGMCKPLTLLGPGDINYMAPFSNKPLDNDIKSLPFGTYANVECSDGQTFYSVCKPSGDSYVWTSIGPFCASGDRSCAINNGGCEHLCFDNEDGAGVRCECKEGYELGLDSLSCGLKDYCRESLCEHRCEMMEQGFSCLCPHGFQLNSDQRSCSDIDECTTQVCEDHDCVNTPGSYTCKCNIGYELDGAKCRDIDECAKSKCAQSCLNSLGSYSCHCNGGFIGSEDGRSCLDIDECASSPCEFTCNNTMGGFSCECPEGHHLRNDGTTCSPGWNDAPLSPNHPVDLDPISVNITSDPMGVDRTSDPTSTNAGDLQNQSARTDTPPALDSMHVITHDEREKNISSVRVGKPVGTKVLVCVVGSVVPLLLLTAVTLAIVVFRCGRAKREAKKAATADGYCWVSSGFEPHLEKLYESILVDDPVINK